MIQYVSRLTSIHIEQTTKIKKYKIVVYWHFTLIFVLDLEFVCPLTKNDFQGIKFDKSLDIHPQTKKCWTPKATVLLLIAYHGSIRVQIDQQTYSTNKKNKKIKNCCLLAFLH